MYQYSEPGARSAMQSTEQAICHVDVRAVRKVSSHFEYLAKRSRGLPPPPLNQQSEY